MPPPDPRSERKAIVAALLELIAEHDYESLGLSLLLRHAGVSRLAFQRHFLSLEDCFATVWSEVDAELSAAIYSAYRGEGEWQDRLRRAILAGLRYLAADPARSRLYLTEAVQVSEELRRRQYDSVLRLGRLIDAGRQKAALEEPLPEAIAEAVSGSIFYRVTDFVRSGHADRLPEQLHELMYLAVLPYRGPGAAEAELRLA